MEEFNRDLKKLRDLKQFWDIIYDGSIGANSIRIFQNNKKNNMADDKEFNRVNFFNKIDDLIKFTTINSYGLNTYFSLALTNGNSGRAEDLTTRTVLAFDFDKKDLGDNFNSKDVLIKFKELKLWYNILIDSGHGYHAYVCIEPTQDMERVAEVQKAIAIKLGADLNAVKTTQILRVPYTFNIKDKPRQVNIIKMYGKETIKRYSLDGLYNKFCTDLRDKVDTKDRATEYILKTSNMPKCIEYILQNGSTEGSRNADLQKIIITLKRLNKSKDDIKWTCKEWNNKNKPRLTDTELEYQVDYIFNNVSHCTYSCKYCSYYTDCFKRVMSDFTFDADYNVLTLTESQTSKLKVTNRKGVKSMESNDLLIYCILKNNQGGLYRDELIKDLTYKKKCRFSKDTLTKALNNLELNGFIEVDAREKGKKLYKVIETQSKVELTYNISYGATYECVKGNITTDELKLYNYMRYLHNKEQRENPKALKGNLFQFKQTDLAKNLGVTQGRISQMINNLLEELLLGVWYRQPSKNNGFDFYIYRLNY